ncbi:MAG: hypothetical protein ACLVCM_11460 [Lachnospira sp.]|jgi:hypothetical protein|uniref:hypothetical protein n=1 Tax=Lachnospira sp. TaxID=2049031 RepID=UPI0015B7B67C|nr:MAG TPA: hypothetical protein [Inoviridae sp.]
MVALFTIGQVNQWLFFANAILWVALILIFVVVRIRTSVQRKKYSVKQQNEVATEYKSSGLQ